MKEAKVYIVAKRLEHGWSVPSKIGVTTNLVNRLITLGTACPFKISCFHQYHLPNTGWARDLEHRFHRRILPMREFGEWFSVHPEEAKRQMDPLVNEMLTDLGYSGELRNQISYYIENGAWLC